MAWIEGVTTPGTIVKDIATQLTTANTNPDGSISSDNWQLVYPRPFSIITATNEALTAIGSTPGNVYQAASGHQTWYPWYTPEVFVGGVAVPASTYTVDYATGKVTFTATQTQAVTATFQYEANNDVKGALTKITNRVVLSTTINSQGATGSGSLFSSDPNQAITSQVIYLEIVKPMFLSNPESAAGSDGTTIPNQHFVKVRAFDKWNDSSQDIYVRTVDGINGSIVNSGSHISDWAKFSWYKDWQEVLVASTNNSNNPDDIMQGITFQPITTKGLYADTPIQFYLATDSQRVALVLMGDPTVNYDNYLISFGYFGRIASFTYQTTDPTTNAVSTNYYSNDTAGNFALTVASSTVPALSIDGQAAVTRDPIMGTVLNTTFSEMWGTNTANGVTDVAMYKTRSGVYFQKHQLSFITPEEYITKDAFNPSRWTGKFHLSPAYVIHGYDGYRGFLDGVVVVDNSSIVHLDDLVVNQGQPNEEVYKYFKISAPFSVFENSANWHYGIAIKKV